MTLDDRARTLPPEELPAFVAELEGAKAIAWQRLLSPAPPAAPADDDLLDAPTMAARLNVPETWLRDAARQGRVPCVRLGHYMRFRVSEVLAAVEEHRIADSARRKGRRNSAGFSAPATTLLPRREAR